MVNSNSSISPQLEQALSTVVDKRRLDNALKALALAEGDREVLEVENRAQQRVIAYLSTEKDKLEKELEHFKILLGEAEEETLSPTDRISQLLREGPPGSSLS